MSDSCETCKYWEHSTNPLDERKITKPARRCRVVSPSRCDGWVYVAADSWCGEFQAKEGGETIKAFTRAELDYHAKLMGCVVQDAKMAEALANEFEACLSDGWRHPGDPYTVEEWWSRMQEGSVERDSSEQPVRETPAEKRWRDD